jgi:hypothetical protein
MDAFKENLKGRPRGLVRHNLTAENEHWRGEQNEGTTLVGATEGLKSSSRTVHTSDPELNGENILRLCIRILWPPESFADRCKPVVDLHKLSRCLLEQRDGGYLTIGFESD